MLWEDRDEMPLQIFHSKDRWGVGFACIHETWSRWMLMGSKDVMSYYYEVYPIILMRQPLKLSAKGIVFHEYHREEWRRYAKKNTWLTMYIDCCIIWI